MNKMYDLRVNSHGNAEPMRAGFFADIDGSKYDENNYIIKGIYRISKKDIDGSRPHYKEAIEKFLDKNGVII